MWRTIPTAALLLASAAGLTAGSPAKLEGARQAPRGDALSITGAETMDDWAEAAEPNVVVLPGSAGLTPAPVERPGPAHPAAAGPPLALPPPPATAPVQLSSLRKAAPVTPSPAGPLRFANRPKLPDDFERDGALYLQRRLGVWREDDAVRMFGPPTRARQAVDPEKRPDGRILAFADPTHRHKEYELDFDARTGYLRTVFVYPWKMKWEDCRKLWGNNVTTTEAANGRRFHSYENRHLDVLVDDAGNVVSFGLY